MDISKEFAEMQKNEFARTTKDIDGVERFLSDMEERGIIIESGYQLAPIDQTARILRSQIMHL